jgi:hypothetical protein
MCKPRVERYKVSPTRKLGGDRVDLAAILSFESIQSCLTTSLISIMLVNLSAASAGASANGNNLPSDVEDWNPYIT